jgi:hypothetical protein
MKTMARPAIASPPPGSGDVPGEDEAPPNNRSNSGNFGRRPLYHEDDGQTGDRVAAPRIVPGSADVPEEDEAPKQPG